MCEIFETLAETGEDLATAKEKLTEYFDPKKNVEYEIYKFQQAKQNPGESMSAYHSRCVSWQLRVNLQTSTRR